MEKYIVVIIISVAIGLVMMHFLIFQPRYDALAKEDEEIKSKIQAELNMINNSTCQQLHDRLLSTDQFYDSDNEAIARDHYVASCGVRLP